MKKIAIATLNGYFNYGNRLQNYAIQETLKTLGYSVETIRFNRDKKTNKYKFYLREIKKWVTNPAQYFTEKKRHEIFMGFSRSNIIETKKVFYMDDDLTQLKSLS